LNKLAEDADQTEETKIEAASLSKKMDKLEFAILTLFWNRVLSWYNEVSKAVHKQDVNLSVVVSLLQSLHLFTSELRDEFSGFELKAKAIATDANYADTTCRKRKRSIRITRFERAARLTLFSLVGTSSDLTHTYL
jgi:hypothetical protein